LIVSSARRRVRAVDATAPLIYSPIPGTSRLSVGGRALALLIAITCLAILVTAALLTPSPTGEGTHQNMGFQSCQFLRTTNVPCPTCGMTTSTSWFARGNWLASFYVQPMGFLFALFTAATFWGALYIAISGRPSYRLLRHLPMRHALLWLMAFAIAAWGWKIFIRLKGIDGWQ
jgi:hypothetical protein